MCVTWRKEILLAFSGKLRAAIIPTPRQQGVDGEEVKTGTPPLAPARLRQETFNWVA
jgi:hypothetical protein